MTLKIERRVIPSYDASKWSPSLPEIIRDIYAARGVLEPETVEHTLSKLIHWRELGGIQQAAQVIMEHILADDLITISGDYDCDGATGTSVAYLGLRMLGARNVKFIVPNRFVHGYGLSPALVDDMDERTKLVITVDSGVSNVEGVARAKELGRRVVITDHHLAGEVLPAADAIVNPNVPGDPFPSKALAGVGVMFYVLLATRARMSTIMPVTQSPPKLEQLLDLVALGTIADLVPLDQNNRILVTAGLKRIRAGAVSPGLKALIEKAGKSIPDLTESDFGFAVGPRLNAAGRMEDMTIGITALTSEDPAQIEQYVDMLEEINNSRKERQQEMIDEASRSLGSFEGPGISSDDAGAVRDTEGGMGEDSAELRTSKDRGQAYGVVLFNPTWHSGIVGLVASKVKDTLYRPTIALAPAELGSSEIRGSARSIPGFHLRDALALVDTRHPGLMKKFGGHAMAAGLSLDISKVEDFKKAFDDVAREIITEDMLNAVIYVDGPVPTGGFCVEFVELLQRCGPWGQGFPLPVFQNDFDVIEQRVIKDKHVSLRLADVRDGSEIKGIFFNAPVLEYPSRIRAVFEMQINVWGYNMDRRDPQLMIRHIEGL